MGRDPTPWGPSVARVIKRLTDERDAARASAAAEQGRADRLQEQLNDRGCEIDGLAHEVKAEKERADRLEEEKNGAYGERNKVVAALSKCFPSCLGMHPKSDVKWDLDWRTIVFVQLPTGQASWHLHDSDVPLFAHLQQDPTVKWDGHTTPEKYERLAALAPFAQLEAAIEALRDAPPVHVHGCHLSLYPEAHVECDPRCPIGGDAPPAVDWKTRAEKAEAKAAAMEDRARDLSKWRAHWEAEAFTQGERADKAEAELLRLRSSFDVRNVAADRDRLADEVARLREVIERAGTEIDGARVRMLNGRLTKDDLPCAALAPEASKPACICPSAVPGVTDEPCPRHGGKPEAKPVEAHTCSSGYCVACSKGQK